MLFVSDASFFLRTIPKCWKLNCENKNMIIFATIKFVQKIIGLQSCGRASHLAYMIVPIFVSIPMVLLVFSILMDFILNIHDDTNRLWSTSSILIALIEFLILYWYHLINHQRFYSLFDSMQDIVDESAWKMKTEITQCNIYSNRKY